MTHSDLNLENGSASSLIEELKAALHQLEASENASIDGVKWMEIEEHFHNLEELFKQQFEELEVREKEYEEKEAKTRAFLAEKEAAIVMKEQELLDRLQDLKDAAVVAIAEERVAHQPFSLECTGGEDNKESKVSGFIPEESSPEVCSPPNRGALVEHVPDDCQPCPKLIRFCEQMDTKRLLSFIMLNKKNVNAQELSIALESAKAPAQLVLDTLEVFCSPSQTTQSIDKTNSANRMRRACSVLIEAMSALLARIDPGAEHLINPDIKQRAKAFADQWKPLLFSTDFDDTHVTYTLEAYTFLQLVSTFRLASEFDEEVLCKLVLLIAGRKLAPELCHSLGLTHKMSGVVETLVNSGKQIDAVRFIHSSQLKENFPPVPLLKAYLSDSRRNSQGKGGKSGGGQNNADEQELVALRAVIKCVKDCKLEADYPLGPLQERLVHLEKSKIDKKREVGDFARRRELKKRKRNDKFLGSSGVSAGVATGVQEAPLFIDRTAYTVKPESYPLAAPNPYNYQVPSQSAYSQQAIDQRMYYYPQYDRVESSSYNAASSHLPHI